MLERKKREKAFIIKHMKSIAFTGLMIVSLLVVANASGILASDAELMHELITKHDKLRDKYNKDALVIVDKNTSTIESLVRQNMIYKECVSLNKKNMSLAKEAINCANYYSDYTEFVDTNIKEALSSKGKWLVNSNGRSQAKFTVTGTTPRDREIALLKKY